MSVTAITAITTSSEPAELLTVDEAARAMRVSKSTVRRLARHGHLPAELVGNQWRIDIDGLPAAARRAARRTTRPNGADA